MHEVFDIESLDLQARGVARRGGKVAFVEGALPGERVQARIINSKASFDIARVERLVHASSQRVEPPCPYFGVCGGCIMQHLEPGAQVAVKQRVLEDALWHIGKLRPGRVLPALHGPSWGYRNRARLSVRMVNKKGGVMVGFRERRSRYVTDMTHCLVLPRHVSSLLVPLRSLIGSMSTPDRLPQIEVSVGDRTTALLLRHLEPLIDSDIALLKTFAADYDVSWWLQPKGLETIHPLIPGDADKLAYALPEYGLRMHYRPGDFTQVNDAMNRSLVVRALALLEVTASDRVADLFCGLGNFTLPLATQARFVMGFEGNSVLTDRAQASSRLNNLQDRVQFATLDLFKIEVQWLSGQGYFDKVLIDPPREGAEAVVRSLSAAALADRPKKIVYVSCSPATLARDAGILVHEGGYRLQAAGVVNMFAHTAHVESIAVFDQGI
jgi:23S rRNA (uracil1939-C5)-methyltransferase